MTPPATPASTHLFTRTLQSERGYDLVVAGGGPGGCGAAIAAARKGARVLLAEATGTLGGMGTSALVSAWSHLANGVHTVIGGLMQEFVESLYAAGGIAPGYDATFWTTVYNRGLGYSTEAYKRLLDTCCTHAGVEVRFFTKVIEAEADPHRKSVNGVILHQVDGLRFVEARAFVDATGDAILADCCGALCRRAGRDTPNIMPPTLCAAIAGIDDTRFHRKDQQAAVEQALADGFFSQPDRHVPGLFRTGKTTAILNAGHLFHLDALDQASLSGGMMQGRSLAREYTEFFRKYLPGCEQIEIVTTAPALGVRESRRIIGEYELNFSDLQARRHFPDQIAIYCKQPDIHVYDCSPEEYARYHKEFESADVLAPGESYGIPYGVLVPRGWRNLWVAGRCCASDLKVNGAIRDQPACVMMGQAAGTAAAQAIKENQSASAIDVQCLISTLKADGAYLPQSGIVDSMSRNEP